MTRPDRPVQFALFDAVADAASEHRGRLDLEPGAVVLRAFAVEEAPALLAAIDQIAQVSPWRHMTTVRGSAYPDPTVSVCQDIGWLEAAHRAQQRRLARLVLADKASEVADLEFPAFLNGPFVLNADFGQLHAPRFLFSGCRCRIRHRIA